MVASTPPVSTAAMASNMTWQQMQCVQMAGGVMYPVVPMLVPGKMGMSVLPQYLPVPPSCPSVDSSNTTPTISPGQDSLDSNAASPPNTELLEPASELMTLRLHLEAFFGSTASELFKDSWWVKTLPAQVLPLLSHRLLTISDVLHAFPEHGSLTASEAACKTVYAAVRTFLENPAKWGEPLKTGHQIQDTAAELVVAASRKAAWTGAGVRLRDYAAAAERLVMLEKLAMDDDEDDDEDIDLEPVHIKVALLLGKILRTSPSTSCPAASDTTFSDEGDDDDDDFEMPPLCPMTPPADSVRSALARVREARPSRHVSFGDVLVVDVAMFDAF